MRSPEATPNEFDNLDTESQEQIEASPVSDMRSPESLVEEDTQEDYEEADLADLLDEQSVLEPIDLDDLLGDML